VKDALHDAGETCFPRPARKAFAVCGIPICIGLFTDSFSGVFNFGHAVADQLSIADQGRTAKKLFDPCFLPRIRL